MTSPPLDSTHSGTTSSVTCHHRLWKACTVKRCHAWHCIIALRQHKWSNDVRRYMPSPPLDCTHGRTSSGMACHHHLWAAHTVERRWAWHDIIAFGQHTRLNNVGRDMPTPPLGSTHSRTTSEVACHYLLWEARMVERCRAWHANITFEQHTPSNDVVRGMPASPLGSTHG